MIGISNTGIYVRDFNIASTGPLSITSEGEVTGGLYGILARNSSGALSIVANGDVKGTSGIGIYAQNDAASTTLSVTSDGVSGGVTGIYARNFGTGVLSITANGDVESTGASSTGIYAKSYGVDLVSGKSLSIVSEAVTGGTTGVSVGIQADNKGTGDLDITANGLVQGVYGIIARNGTISTPAGNDLRVTSEAVTATSDALYAGNFGSGSLTIIANGDVESAVNVGINARNYGTDLSVTSASVTGGTSSFGILARNGGTGMTSIVTNGEIEGGFAIFARHYGTGLLTITTNADVQGTSNEGVYARAANGATVTVNSDVVTGVTSGVRFVAGTSNKLTNFGGATNIAGLGGTAILGDTGNETIDNFGVVTGNIALGTGTNAFNNTADGLFNSGATVDVGAGNLLTNHGTLSPGGAFSAAGFVTSLTGNFAQPGSELEVNLQGANADRLDVSGDTALAGKVKPLFTLSGLGSFTQWNVLNSGTPIDNNGIEAVSTAAVSFDLIFPTVTQMDLVLAGVNFAPDGLNKNETAIAKNINKIFDAGSGDLVSLLDALAALPNVGSLAQALDQLSPEIYLDNEIATLFSSLAFTNSLMTCPTRDGSAAFIKEGQCVWARLSGREFNQDKTFQTIGFEEDSFEVAGGMQGALGDVWRVGFAGAYEQSFLDTDTGASSDADRIHGGAVIKYNPGPLLLAAAVSGGFGWYDTDRTINFPGFFASAHSDNEIGYVDGRFRAEYLLSAGKWYAKPMVDLDATHINLDGVNESGAGGVGLKVGGSNETVFSATPALELGTQFGNPNGTLVRPYIRGGVTIFDDPDFVLLASFEGAPSGIGPFRIAASTDDLVADVSAGVDVIGVEGASFRLYYDGRFGDTVEEHAGGIKASWPF